MPVILLLLTLLPGHASFAGAWKMDRVRSQFGSAAAPQEFVLEIEQTGNHLAAAVFSADANGQRVSYRECELQPTFTCLMPVDETWQMTGANELTITRVVTTKSQAVRQRLVLERSTPLE